MVEATISGTSLTFSSAVRANASAVGVNTSLAFDSNSKKVLFSYRDETNSKGRSVLYQVGYTSATGGTIADGKAVVLNSNGTVSTVSQTAASVGTEAAFNSITSAFFTTVFDSSNNKHIIVYRTSSNMRYVVATVASDGGVSFGTDAVVLSGDHQGIASAFDSTNNRVATTYLMLELVR